MRSDKLTKQTIENWTDEEFQIYRLHTWNRSHNLKVSKKDLPLWYMPSKEDLIKMLESKKVI